MGLLMNRLQQVRIWVIYLTIFNLGFLAYQFYTAQFTMIVHKVLMLLVSILGIIYSFMDPKALNFLIMAGQLMNYLFLYNE